MKLKIFTLLVLASALVRNCNAQQWSSVGNGLVSNQTGGKCYALNYFNGNLYASGDHISINGTLNQVIAQWNGNTWAPVGGLSSEINRGNVTALTNMNGILYACGGFDSINGMAANYIAQWDGNSWAPLGTGIQTGDTSYPFAMIGFEGNLIVGGNFAHAGSTPVSSVAKWDGTTWSAMGNGIRTHGGGFPFAVAGSVAAFAVYNNSLYAGGTFYSETGPGDTVYGMAKWDGNTWSLFAPLNVLDGNFANAIRSLCVYNNMLYAGGDFDSIAGIAVKDFARWDGVSWSSVGSFSCAGNPGSVNALATYKGDLFATGLFYGAGAQPDTAIARFNGTSWLPVESIRGIGYALVGDSNGLFVGAENMWNEDNTLTLVKTYTAPTGTFDLKNEEAAHIFPNPTTGKFSVLLSNDERTYTVHIYNITGDKITQTLLTQNKIELDLTNEPSGIYLYRIISSDGLLCASGKILIQ